MRLKAIKIGLEACGIVTRNFYEALPSKRTVMQNAFHKQSKDVRLQSTLPARFWGGRQRLEELAQNDQDRVSAEVAVARCCGVQEQRSPHSSLLPSSNSWAPKQTFDLYSVPLPLLHLKQSCSTGSPALCKLVQVSSQEQMREGGGGSREGGLHLQPSLPPFF